jgi:hypothetical protein
MKHDEHDELWDLLGRARPVKASPFFSRNVLRLIRESEPERERGFMEWLRAGWNWLALSGAVAAILLLAVGLRTQVPQSGSLVAADSTNFDEVVHSPDFAVIANLDALVAMDDNDVWLESKLR